MADKKANTGKVVPLRRIGGKSCPKCGKPSVEDYRPFCSKRCADLDLGGWLNESYRIASDEEAGFDDEAPED
ncbi:MAG: DNA gyrase inhibitor YacG [Rhodospirillaceae bacterium]|nr:DNA gyrase inhibitor YacG [Rhodospirillaceae bacterium]